MRALLFALLLVGSAGAQTFKGACDGTESDPHDLSAIPATPAITCDSMTVTKSDSHTTVTFSNGLAFAGDLYQAHPGIPQPFAPGIGPVVAFFQIDTVIWGDGTPLQHVTGDTQANRGCYFHSLGDRFTQVECELIAGNPRRRATVTFTVK